MGRGQITIFILVGVVLVLVTAFIFAGQITPSLSSSLSSDFRPVQDRLTQCFRGAAEAVVSQVGLQGGIYAVAINEKSVTLPIMDYYANKKSQVPSVERIAETIGHNVDNTIPACIVSASDGQLEARGDPFTEVVANEKEIIFKIKYPLKITLPSGSAQVQDFAFVLPVRLKHDLKLAQDIVNNQLANNGFFDKNQFFGKDVNFEYRTAGDSIVITIIDEKSRVSNGPFVLMFALNFAQEVKDAS